MTQKLELQLREKYPGFFRDLYGDPRETCMAWGCSCGDGWYDLIDRTCQKILDLNPPDDFKLAQVKEKFGALRIYVDSAREEIWDLLSDAEEESLRICETCGSEVDVASTGSWVKTLCSECRNTKENSN